MSIMEIANLRYGIRPAHERDSLEILRLLANAPYRHLHADWRLPVDWLGSPGFVVAQDAEAGGELVGALCLTADPLPAAWIRVAAVTEIDARQILGDMLEAATSRVRDEGVSQVGWLAMDDWPDQWLPGLGFQPVNWITTYEKDDLEIPGASPLNLDHRPAEAGDMAVLARLEASAYEPLWRHSRHGLAMAMKQTLSFDVALEKGALVGFQYSVAAHDGQSAHLVRLTVDPAVQGRGVGSFLLSVAMAGYRLRGIRRVTLNTQIDNHPSRRLYEKFGFRCLGDRIPVWATDVNNG
jgi:ribosomal protein S18 acetylase RimI-like enzyme